MSLPELSGILYMPGSCFKNADRMSAVPITRCAVGNSTVIDHCITVSQGAFAKERDEG